MANAIYPRKGTLTRGNVKTLLGADSIFNSLSDAQKNSVIDISVHKIASLRNKLLKPDYDFDTSGNSDVLSSAVGYLKFASYIFIEAGTTYNSVLYASNTVLESSPPSGWTSDPTTSRVSDIISVLSSANELLADTQVTVNGEVTYERIDDGEIQFDVSGSTGVVAVEIYRR